MSVSERESSPPLLSSLMLELVISATAVGSGIAAALLLAVMLFV